MDGSWVLDVISQMSDENKREVTGMPFQSLNFYNILCRMVNQ